MFSSFKKWIAQLKDGPIDWDQLEAVLIQSDLGVDLAMRIMDRLKSQTLSSATIRKAAADELLSLWPKATQVPAPEKGRLNVWLVVGVNGTGKTTTIAKLSHLYHKQGFRIHLVAADTFRAAAIDQMKVWANRLGLSITCGREGGDPAAAAYEGIEEARKLQADIVLIDTAGRLHNKENLMRELEKMKRVIAKQDGSAPHLTLQVIDGLSGSNAVAQAKEFHSVLGLHGIVVTKLDSSAKGGAIAALKSELKLDTVFVCDGENLDDIAPFDAAAYVNHFFGEMEPEEAVETFESKKKKGGFFGLFGKK